MPFCGRLPDVKQVQAEFNIDLFQVRNFLGNIHQNAFAGARLPKAASLQGKFWENDDSYTENQSMVTIQ